MTATREAARDLTRVPMYAGRLPSLEHDVTEWPGRIIEHGGVRLHVRCVEGSGPDGETAVYVHGLGGSSTNWTRLAGLLSERMHGLIVDLPGFGRSEPPRDYAYTMDAHADTVVGFLDGLDGGPVHLFGNSMGGAIAMMVAAKRPDLVRTLTLVSPAVPDLRPSPRRASDPRIPLAFLPIVGKPIRRSLAAMSARQRSEQLVRLCFAQPEEVTPQQFAAFEAEAAERMRMPWARAALDRSTVGLLRSWLVSRSNSLWSVASRIAAPTLVVWGTDDRLVGVRKAPRTARSIPNARLLILPRTGHVAQMERPESVARAVLGMAAAVDQAQW